MSGGANGKFQIVVVGGGYAGVLAALRAARRTGERAQVTLVNASDQLVERIRLHQLAAGQSLPARPLAKLLRGSDVRLRVGRVQALDAARRRLRVDGGWLDADAVLLATGSVIDVQSVPGVVEHAHTLGGPERALALGGALAAGARRLMVCGGGTTALEAATELAAVNPALRVTLLTRGQLGEGVVGERGRRHLLTACARLGIEVAEESIVDAIERDAALLRGARVGFDVCLWAGGMRAAPLARQSGLTVDDRDQLLVADTLAVPGQSWLFAAGDAAHVVAHAGAPIAMSCKTAMPMGAHVADNLGRLLAGEALRPLRWGDTGVCISLGRSDALIQRRDRAGRNHGVVRGRVGAWIKELVCRYTVAMLALERRVPGAYRWPGAPRQLPAAGTSVAS